VVGWSREALLNLRCRTTYADYLATEQNSERRHEFIDGVIVAMAGGSDEHNAIGFRLSVLLGSRMSSGCQGYSADQRFWIEATGRGRYSDGSIICGKPEHPAHDPQATTNPAVVIEVLSPTTQGDDEGEKCRDFQSLPSLQAYVMVTQDARCVKVYRRTDGGAWRDEPEIYRGGERFELPRLTRAIAVDEIYDNILDATGRSLLR
jgi:Uma2 family endonuclease